MDENYPLSEYNKIQLGHNCTNDAVYSKDLLCTFDIRQSFHASFRALILLNPNNHYNHRFITFLTTSTLFILTIYCA